jgi:hypothetical protein
MWEDFMNDLRASHIKDPIGGANGTRSSPVLARLTAAYEDARKRSVRRLRLQAANRGSRNRHLMGAS